MKTIFAFILIVISIPVFSTSDYKIEALAIPYPLGAYLKGEYGYSLPFWKGSDIFYGFLRPSLSIKSSGKINTASGRLELYPISIVGGYIERSNSSRKSDELPTFDCGVVACENSNVERTSYGLRFAFKISRFYLMSDISRRSINLKGNPKKTIADEQTTLLAKQGGDRSLQILVSTGFNINQSTKMGILFKHSEMERLKNMTNLGILYSKFEFGDSSLLVGPGAFRDRNAHLHPTFLVIYNWVGSKGLLLF